MASGWRLPDIIAVDRPKAISSDAPTTNTTTKRGVTAKAAGIIYRCHVSTSPLILLLAHRSCSSRSRSASRFCPSSSMRFNCLAAGSASEASPSWTATFFYQRTRIPRSVNLYGFVVTGRNNFRFPLAPVNQFSLTNLFALDLMDNGLLDPN